MVERIERLSDEASAKLLKDNGVKGSGKDLRAAARDFGGHPLALSLLASYLRETQNGDVRRRDHIRSLLADAGNPGHDHARRVMELYEKEWLAGQPLLPAIMFLVGLFDRPATADCLAALRAAPAIDGLTAQIVVLDDADWNRAISRLRDARLLSPEDPSAPGALDAHPLVREWFGERLRQTNEAAWKDAHGRVYEHLRNTTHEGDAPTLEALAPLFHAITHGCRGGRHQKAYNVLVERLIRRHPDGHLRHYNTLQLGAWSSALAVISWFFDPPFESPAATLPAANRAFLLGNAGYWLRTQGRLREALQAMRAALPMAEEAADWMNAVVRASNTSETELLRGEVSSAVATAQRGVEFADHLDHDHTSEYRRMVSRTSLADALATAGNGGAAEALFAEASSLQRTLSPGFFNARRGQQYCDFLISRGKFSDARYCAARRLEAVTDQGWRQFLSLDMLL